MPLISSFFSLSIFIPNSEFQFSDDSNKFVHKNLVFDLNAVRYGNINMKLKFTKPCT